jgi:16S rRNA (guanine(966)-N(2))-methyltransferase RsmD
MRIIAGTKKGMTLLSPKGTDTRPITDRVKESVFNILFSKGFPQDCAAADLFCGTGSMGLEALSRGAAWVTFIDKNFKAVEILKQNITKSGFLPQSRAICADVFRAGAPATPEHAMYDLVFVDPPYAMTFNCGPGSQVEKLLTLLDSQVSQAGLVVLRTHQNACVSRNYGRLVQIDNRQWGNMAVAFFQKQTGSADQSPQPKCREPINGDENE